LSRAKDKAKGMSCVSNMKQIVTANRMYLDDNSGKEVPLWISPVGTAPWNDSLPSYVVNDLNNNLWWQDTFRLNNYAPNGNVFDCPSLLYLANRVQGGSISTNHTLGIALNHPEFGDTAPQGSNPLSFCKDTKVKQPDQAMVFADAGSVLLSSFKIQNPDAWLPDISVAADFGGGVSYYREPSDSLFSSGDSVSLNRHNNRCDFGFFDGHAELLKNSAAGYYQPNYTPARLAPGALWARDHIYATPYGN
jgi:prepilin-type processing-associated H-X9-DG protein